MKHERKYENNNEWSINESINRTTTEAKILIKKEPGLKRTTIVSIKRTMTKSKIQLKKELGVKE